MEHVGRVHVLGSTEYVINDDNGLVSAELLISVIQCIIQRVFDVVHDHVQPSNGLYVIHVGGFGYEHIAQSDSELVATESRETLHNFDLPAYGPHQIFILVYKRNVFDCNRLSRVPVLGLVDLSILTLAHLFDKLVSGGVGLVEFKFFTHLVYRLVHLQSFVVLFIIL